VVDALLNLSSEYITIPGPGTGVPEAIALNPKFAPYFSKCRMATDGTHLPVFVPSAHADAFRGRKGLTQNVLASCSFDLQFTYVLAGWEGTAADGKLMADAIAKDYRIDEGYFDLGDAGFALTPYMLTPYRGVRYHLNEWAQGNMR
jgi:hypothetical protein